jgi:hypothetical protein
MISCIYNSSATTQATPSALVATASSSNHHHNGHHALFKESFLEDPWDSLGHKNPSMNTSEIRPPSSEAATKAFFRDTFLEDPWAHLSSV